MIGPFVGRLNSVMRKCGKITYNSEVTSFTEKTESVQTKTLNEN